MIEVCCVFRYTIFKDHVTLEDCILYLPSVCRIACDRDSDLSLMLSFKMKSLCPEDCISAEGQTYFSVATEAG